jgi:signal transduction histidine kinase
MLLALLPSSCKSIKAQSVALILVYVLILCGIYSAFTISLVRREVDQARNRFQQTAQLVATELDAYLESGRQRLNEVARLPGMLHGLRTIREKHGEGYIPAWATLHYLFFKSPVFTGGVFLLDHGGKVLWTEPPGISWLGQVLMDYPPIADMYRYRQPLVIAEVKNFRLLQTPYVVMGVPVQDASEEPTGMLGGVIDLASDKFTYALREASTGQGKFIEIIDGNNLVLASTNSDHLFQPSQSVLPNDSLLLASVPLTQAPWRVVAGQPRAIALAEVSRLQQLLFWLGLSVIAAAMASGAPFVNGFVRPIKLLTRHAEVMARGDLSTPVSVAGRHDEIATLAHAFERMRVELNSSHVALKQRLAEREELIRLKEEFLANISHELRTPLNIIIGYTDMLCDETTSDEGRNLLTRIRGQAEHLFHLLSDLMTLSGVNIGKITLQLSPTPIGDILTRLSSLVERLRQGKNLHVVWDHSSALPTIETDPLRLEQILANLITNAFKFTSQGTITIRAYVREETASVVFEVADTGIGIPPHELPYIFDEFRQVDGSMSRHYGGMGLGLALVKKLTTLLHGEVFVTSTVGQGSTFTVILPLRLDSVPPRQTSPDELTL